MNINSISDEAKKAIANNESYLLVKRHQLIAGIISKQTPDQSKAVVPRYDIYSKEENDSRYGLTEGLTEEEFSELKEFLAQS